MISLHLLTPRCFEEIFVKFNLEPECVKYLLSRGLGLGIVAGSTMVKLPQIFKILGNRDAAGLSFLGVLLELLAVRPTAPTASRKGFRSRAYGESVFLSLQTSLIAILILWYGGNTVSTVVFLCHLRHRCLCNHSARTGSGGCAVVRSSRQHSNGRNREIDSSGDELPKPAHRSAFRRHVVLADCGISGQDFHLNSRHRRLGSDHDLHSIVCSQHHYLLASLGLLGQNQGSTSPTTNTQNDLKFVFELEIHFLASPLTATVFMKEKWEFKELLNGQSYSVMQVG